MYNKYNMYMCMYNMHMYIFECVASVSKILSVGATL